MELAKRLGISRDGIFFAGTKDKRALTTQYVSLRAPANDVLALDIRDVEILETHRVDRAPKIGELVGNRFILRIRNTHAPATEALETARAALKELADIDGGFPNYFGPQRFGTVRPITHLVGDAILHGNLEEAVRRYVGNPQPGEPTDVSKARANWDATRDHEKALHEFPRFLSFERMMVERLLAKSDDYEGALLSLPGNLRTMFVYAAQSVLFNKILSRRLTRGMGLNEPHIGDLVVGLDAEGRPERENQHPVTSRNLARVTRLCSQRRALVTGAIYGSQSTLATGEPGEIEHAVIEESGYTSDMFRTIHLPEVSSKGTRRELLAPLGPVRCDTTKDAHGDYLELSFFLLKGSYATSLLRELMKTPAADLA